MTDPDLLPDSYWVEHGQLLAGEYPGAVWEQRARLRFGALWTLGVTHVLDLTEAHELPNYLPLLHEEAAALGREVTYERRSVRDFDIPSDDAMRTILDALDAALASGGVAYLHCHGGVGRTVTVVGCHLVRRGATGDDALAQIRGLRRACRSRDRSSPETEPQRALVRRWAERT